MNERLNLQDLVDLLADKQKITKKEADTFLRELIALIIENIENIEPVKIKDFGTFKPTRIAARKSVNVNTGEAFEIASHYKLTFAPDKVLREAVNRPFSHFESVVLEDGVSFDDVESTSDISEDQEDDADDIVNEHIDVASVNNSLDLELVNVHESAIESDMLVDTADYSDTVKEPIVIPALEEPVTSPEPVGILDDDTAEAISKEDKIEIADPVNKLGNSIDLQLETGIDEVEGADIRRKILMVIAVLLVGGGACAWFFKDQIDSGWANIWSGKNTEIRASDEKENNVAQQLPVAEDTLAVHSSALTSTRDTLNILIPDKEKRDADNKRPVLEEDVIKELPKQVTIASGMTLRSIGLANYGHKSFWVYIYKDNKAKIKNPNNVPLGTILTLPPASKYSIDAKNPESIRKAKDLEMKIYVEFGIK